MVCSGTSSLSAEDGWRRRELISSRPTTATNQAHTSCKRSMEDIEHSVDVILNSEHTEHSVEVILNSGHTEHSVEVILNSEHSVKDLL